MKRVSLERPAGPLLPLILRRVPTRAVAEEESGVTRRSPEGLGSECPLDGGTVRETRSLDSISGGSPSSPAPRQEGKGSCDERNLTWGRHLGPEPE